MQQTHYDTIIIGAGISGLTCAYRLQEAGQRVLLLEKAPRFGGAIRSARDGEWLIEAGPNSTLETTPLLTELIRDAGVEDQKLYASDASKNRYILKHGKLTALPMSPPAFFKTGLFTWGTKLGLFGEPFRKPSPPDAQESVADFVRRRLGQEFLDYAINPFVAGVYAGDPELLSVRAAFPKLYELEQTYGGLIKGQIKGARERKKRGEESKQSARMFSFLDGMQTLTDALARAIPDKLHSADVRAIRIGPGVSDSGNARSDANATDSGNARSDANATDSGNARSDANATDSGNARSDANAVGAAAGGASADPAAGDSAAAAGGEAADVPIPHPMRFTVTVVHDGGEKQFTARDLIVATPAGAAAELSREFAPELSAVLEEIPYPPVAEVITGYTPTADMHPLDGFGFLIPKVEGRRILGTIFSSTIFRKRAPEGKVHLTTFIGGMRQPEEALRPDEEIVQTALDEQRALLGTPEKPDFVYVTAWKHAIPQYVRGHLERMATVDAVEERIPGLHYCANYRGGISVGDCVKSAHAVVERVMASR